MKNTIKIWPYIDDFSQTIIPYQSSNLNIDNKIFIDFSNVRSINSSGIAITVFKILPLLNKHKNSVWIVEEPEDDGLKSFLSKTGVYKILSNNILNKDLFSSITNSHDITDYVQNSSLEMKTTSFPLIVLDYGKFDYRVCVEDFIDKLINILMPFNNTYNIKLNIFLKLLKEIAKNSEDHTSTSAIFGIDIIENENTKKGKLLFSFCDFGIGIHENIKKHIAKDSRYRENASTKLGIVDSYHSAYRPGFTTSKKQINKGIGMSMILDCTKILGLNLSIFDARSMGFIPKSNTHEEIRRNFWNTGNAVGFYYYGSLDLN